MLERPFRIANTSGDTIRGDVRYEEDGNAKPVVVVCHGFTAHKDWGPFPYFGRRFAEQGFVSAVFNFSHNGIGANPRRFTELDRFSKNTIGKEMEDVQAVIDAFISGEIGNGVADAKRIGILGHSRGGGIAILSASRDDRLKAVAAWSTVGTFFRYSNHQLALWREQGFLPVKIRSKPSRLRYGLEVLNDLEAHREMYDLRLAVQRLRVPLLLLHGREDLAVKPREAEDLYEVADTSLTQLVLLDNVGHMYGARNPFEGTNATIEKIIELTALWFAQHL